MSAITRDRARTRPPAANATRAATIRLAHRLTTAVAPITWQVFLVSRLVVWLVGGLATQGLGVVSLATRSFDPAGVGTAHGPLANLLLAPAVRWDAIWYLQIAAHGYRSSQDASFFPFLPLVIRAVATVTGNLRVAGVLVGLLACLAALETVRRLAAFELGEAVGRRTVALVAFGPASVFLSAVYTDGLYLALATGAFLSARRGRWARAGVLGALSAVTRPAGWLLVVPLLVLYLDERRGTTADERTGARRWWPPRHGLGPDVAWLALVAALPAVFAVYLGAHGYGLIGTVAAQRHYMHHSLTLPWVGAWDGLRAGAQAAVGVLSGAGPGTTQAVVQAIALVVVACGVVGTFRRLPVAYGLSAVLPLLVHLASPTAGDPLRGFARYASLRFSLFMCAASWSLERGVGRRAVVIPALLMALFAAQFATWHIVGSLTL